MQVSIVGLDIAKNVFQIHGVNAKGCVVLRKRLRRSQLTDFFVNLPACIIGMESTRGAHFWARILGTLGHTVRLVAPQFVKPYLKQGAKNDLNDAAAICEAVSRPHMRFVPQKTIEQQDLQCIHHVRSRLVGCRMQLCNQIRGLLAEYGIEIPAHVSQLRKTLPELTEEKDDRLAHSRSVSLKSSQPTVCVRKRPTRDMPSGKSCSDGLPSSLAISRADLIRCPTVL